MGCSPWGHEESDTTERLRFHFSLSCIGEGNGNPLQCSCLENPGDGGAWWAAVSGVAQSGTPLKRLSSSSSNTWPHSPLPQLLLAKVNDDFSVAKAQGHLTPVITPCPGSTFSSWLLEATVFIPCHFILLLLSDLRAPRHVLDIVHLVYRCLLIRCFQQPHGLN